MTIGLLGSSVSLYLWDVSSAVLSPPVVIFNCLDMRTHICPSHENCPLSSEKDCILAQIWERIFWRSQRGLLENSEIEEVFKRTSGGEKRLSVGDVTKTPAIAVAELQRSVVRDNVERMFDRTKAQSAFLWLYFFSIGLCVLRSQRVWSNKSHTCTARSQVTGENQSIPVARCQSGCLFMHIK